MGSEDLESKANEPQENYRIVNHSAVHLPKDFRNLVIAPFLNSLKQTNDFFKLIDRDAYYIAYKKYVENLLNRPNSIVKLAMLSDETVLGWSLIENKTLHYIWVKNEVRRRGIGQSLLPKEFDTISHLTNKGLRLWVTHYPGVKFDPF